MLNSKNEHDVILFFSSFPQKLKIDMTEVSGACRTRHPIIHLRLSAGTIIVDFQIGHSVQITGPSVC